MAKKIYLCSIEDKYINYLRKFDEIVLLNKDTKRKYVGVLFQIGNFNYYAPLSSPKPKHLNISDMAPDIFKIDNGKLGVINLNNMIPVPEFEIIRINIEEIEDEKYKNLLRDQARFINKYREKIKKKARVLYSIVNSNSNSNLNKRCCNYKLLEIKCKEYEMVDSIKKIAATLEKDE
ncbi:type III toxin-antitoxin system ToxN/AbiQ family toxin [Caloramator sp. E03]|uniref:type III toxin-antitoxin system ToxN/AbiQ family toxin n=1 Tax=Caloramator sp. E03 TaxID=2576307 RepID=UPI001110AD9D|nr:type III toxin-antitoxin system ToxN/AbiQ family toxin [Caloramator sp. E03]QCX34672.1 type III toxin-antitoxin system ToxN/AbiQ family toxin [Caloramator sp. E03]